MKRVPLLLTILLVGAALVAYPIVNPVPDPDEQLQLNVQPPSDEQNYSPVVEYQQLSTNAQAVFNEAATNGTAAQAIGQAPERWVTQANSSQRAITQNYVVRKDQYYSVFATLNDSSGRFRLNVRPPPDARTRSPVVEYRELPADARALFNEAATNGTATRPIKQAPERWVTQTNGSQLGAAQTNYVIRNGNYYATFPTRESPSPPLPAIASRLSSLGIGICLILYTAYRSVIH